MLLFKLAQIELPLGVDDCSDENNDKVSDEYKANETDHAPAFLLLERVCRSERE